VSAASQASKDFLADVLEGLGESQKTLPCKYFYDVRGSELFEAICELDEYYLTRTELAIMEAHGSEMADWIGRDAILIEYGNGTSRKTRLLLDALDRPAVYVPIDISPEPLAASAEGLRKTFPELEVLPLCADYSAPVAVPQVGPARGRRIVYFPGSSIGNFPPSDAKAFLDRMGEQVGPRGGVLVGADLKKEATVLERAYDDARGVTADFNRNLLRRINRELGGDFREGDFRHEARWNARHGRVEMHLVCTEACVVEIAGTQIRFDTGESIHTENSYKYDVEGFEALAAEAGLERRDRWSDPGDLFSVYYFEVAGATSRHP